MMMALAFFVSTLYWHAEVRQETLMVSPEFHPREDSVPLRSPDQRDWLWVRYQAAICGANASQSADSVEISKSDAC